MGAGHHGTAPRHAAAGRSHGAGVAGRGTAALIAVALATGLLVGPSAADPGRGADAGAPAGGTTRLVDRIQAPALAQDHAAPPVGEAPSSGDVLPPDPDDPAAAVQQIIDLSHRAEQANQAVLAGRQKVDAAVAARQRAEDARRDARWAVDQAQAKVEQYRETADWVAVANYAGAHLRSMYAVVLSDSPQQLLDKMSALDQVTYDTQQQMSLYRSAVADAERAQDAADRAADAAEKAAREAADAQARLVDRQNALRDRIGQVRSLYARMTGAAREQLAGALIPDGFDPESIVGSGREYAALQVALTRIGDPYVWGATGPDRFDCSGLVQWAYKQVGIDLPRTSQQQAVGGMPVAPDDMRPGDVITFYDDASHVGIYAGDGMMVHASTFGVPVKIQAVDSFPVHDVRRY